MKKCADIGKIPYSMGIDTWAVDFVLLDDQGQRIGDAVAYRDARTDVEKRGTAARMDRFPFDLYDAR